jgi:hypothetical protein
MSPDDEKRAEGDGLMAAKPKQRNMSHATLALNRSHPPPAVRRIVKSRGERAIGAALEWLSPGRANWFGSGLAEKRIFHMGGAMSA